MTITVDRDVRDATVWPSRIVRIVARCGGGLDGRQTWQAAAAGVIRGLWPRVEVFPVCPCWTGRKWDREAGSESHDRSHIAWSTSTIAAERVEAWLEDGLNIIDSDITGPDAGSK